MLLACCARGAEPEGARAGAAALAGAATTTAGDPLLGRCAVASSVLAARLADLLGRFWPRALSDRTLSDVDRAFKALAVGGPALRSVFTAGSDFAGGCSRAFVAADGGLCWAAGSGCCCAGAGTSSTGWAADGGWLAAPDADAGTKAAAPGAALPSAELTAGAAAAAVIAASFAGNWRFLELCTVWRTALMSALCAAS